MDNQYITLTQNIINSETALRRLEIAKSVYLEYLGHQSMKEKENVEISE